MENDGTANFIFDLDQFWSRSRRTLTRMVNP